MRSLPYSIELREMAGDDLHTSLGVKNSINDKVLRMLKSRANFRSKTGEDHEYDLVAWYKCILTCQKLAFDGRIRQDSENITVSELYKKDRTPEALEVELHEIEAKAILPERISLVELARIHEKNL
ncbi:hypothetical protein [Rubinisphaera italica]|uniref:Uncharacterized protein n=1 Tax=Rubinisphaera italica TaxID=2527969 RepID=A0A5C5XKB9_9PLAN|nr:hypothetical protein [Rubinisphaera italica]TWT63380.1 hypothetical protein Pan54_41330 [Rubinisphaera italica]